MQAPLTTPKHAPGTGESSKNSKKLILKNIPNILSGYRLAATPFIILAIFCSWRDWFFILIMVNLVTDILDGLIARAFKLETEFGAFLDSTADMATYLCAVAGFTYFEYAFVSAHSAWFIAMVGCYLLSQLTALIRFKRNTSYHLYSNKITGYLQGIFILLYYINYAHPFYFMFMVIFSCLAYLESFIITLCIAQLRSNVKSLYFMLRQYGRIQ